MLCKYVLTIDSISYDIPNSCIKNWDEIKFSLKRTELAGIARTFTSKFEFIESAYDLLLGEYLKNEFNADVSIAVYNLDNNHEYSHELFNCRLDFSTLSYDSYVLSINSIDDSIDSLLKAKKNTQYEIPVVDIKSDKSLYYDRILIFNSIKFYVYDKDYGSFEQVSPEGDEVVISYNGTQGGGGIKLPLIDGDKSEVYNSTNITLLDNMLPENYGAIMKFNASMEVEITMDFHVKRSSNGVFSINAVIIEGSMQHTLSAFYRGNGYEFDVKKTFKIPRNYSVSGNMLAITFTRDPYRTSYLKISKFKEFSVKYSSVDKPVSVDVITPINLLTGLVKNINEENKNISCEIVSNVDERLDMSLIVAAESLRGLPDAKIYTSYKKFVEWMEVEFGFVQQIEGNILRFIHRDSLFKKHIVRDLGSNHSGFKFSVDESKIYSSVSVGYEKQDYDNINGRDEFRFMAEYTSGVNITSNKLELISPYRADVYGIEFLVQERGKDTTDNESDNDVFFVGAKYNASKDQYVLIRDGYLVEGVLNSTMMFNAMYWQRAMLEANRNFLGIFTKRLKFACSDGNSEVSVNSVSLKDDFVINERLVTCGCIDVETPDYEILEDNDGIITLEDNGLVYSCYLQNNDVCIGRIDGSKYKLNVKSISKK